MGYITYKQYDSRWGSKNYNGSSSMATAGCGPTSVAMLAYAVDGKTNPWDVALYMKKHGYAIRNNGTAWSGIPAAMKHFGLEDVKNVSSMSDVFALFRKGYCAVFLFRAGSKGGITWTTAGHYIAVTDMKMVNNKHYLYTRDSGGRGQTGWYPYETTMRGLIPQIWMGKVPPKTERKNTKAAVIQYDGPLPNKTLKRGDKGKDVEALQEFLNFALQGAWSTCKYDKLKVDGKFGVKVEQAVKLFKDVNHFKSVNGTFGSTCRKRAKGYRMHKRVRAINWAVAIARDNDFSYGTGQRAHHNGCYFCGTNINGPKHAKKGTKWEKTYCCNPYIHAAYAHGAKDPDMLRACKSKDAADMHPKSWKRFRFVQVGKAKNVPFAKLKRGDVIISASQNHVWMTTGKDGFVEATSSGGFGPSSIAHKNGCREKYNRYCKMNDAYVMRYRI